jgi:4-hydroxybenzoate polyprenyltransferase
MSSIQSGSANGARAGAGGQLAALVAALRPHQWTKNVFLFAALIFSGHLTDPAYLWRALAAFGLFCGLSGAVYLINDLADLEKDRAHPEKRHRPLASGRLSPTVAVVAALLLGGGGLLLSLRLGNLFALGSLLYLLANLAYSLALKRVVILDVMLVASGYTLRAVAGGWALEGAGHVRISHWLVLCTSLLALFLGFCKRRQELVSLADSAAEHRLVLSEYSVPFLDQMISVVTASTLVAYTLYTFDPETILHVGTEYLGLTIPFVLYGIFRYFYLVHQRGEGGNPSRLVMRDVPLLVNLLLYGAAVLVILYAVP